MTAALEGGEWSTARPGHSLPPGKTRYPFYRRLGGPQGRSGGAEYLVPTGIPSRTVQPVDQSLYRLSYRAHSLSWYLMQMQIFTCKQTCSGLPMSNRCYRQCRKWQKIIGRKSSVLLELSFVQKPSLCLQSFHHFSAFPCSFPIVSFQLSLRDDLAN